MYNANPPNTPYLQNEFGFVNNFAVFTPPLAKFLNPFEYININNGLQDRIFINLNQIFNICLLLSENYKHTPRKLSYIFIYQGPQLFRQNNPQFILAEVLIMQYKNLKIHNQLQIMMNNSSKQRLRLAHQVLDKQLSNSSFGRSSMTKQTQISRPKNVQSEISQLERKLMDLEKKMENIDVSSSNQDDDDNIMKIVGKSSRNSRTGLDHFENSKQKPRALSKNSKLSARKINKQGSDSDEQDSEDDAQIYAKLQLENQKRKLYNAGNNSKKQQNNETKQPKITFNKQPEKPQPLSNQFNTIPNNEKKKVSSRKQIIITEPKISKQKNPLRNSIKSIKSNKSRKSINSYGSKGSNRKMQRSTSKNSIKSIQKGGLDKDDLRELQLQNAKDLKKISNLEKELNHYKRLCQKQQEKLQQYRVMEIQFKKLQSNFAKSQQIRKQQKKIIENLKVKN